MYIRLAEEKDLERIMEIIADTVKEMHQNNNFQWDSDYPNREVSLKDIRDGVLYAAVDEDNVIAGLAVFNLEKPDSYSDVVWKAGENDYVIHRLAVDVKQRSTGIAKLLVDFGDKMSLEKNLDYMMTDTNSKNIKAKKFFEKSGYEYVGKITFPGKEGDFYCYEKKLKR